MSEEDLKNRCAGLAYWMCGILTRYHMLDIDRKYIVNEFLKINTPKTAEEGVRNKAIIHALSRKPARPSVLSRVPSERSTCTEGLISYAAGDSVAVRSPSIGIPPRESNSDVSIPEIPVEYYDGPETIATSTSVHVPVTGKREVVSGERARAGATHDKVSEKKPATVFQFEERSSEAGRTNSSDLETIRIESTESGGSCLDVSYYIFTTAFYDCSK